MDACPWSTLPPTAASGRRTGRRRCPACRRQGLGTVNALVERFLQRSALRTACRAGRPSRKERTAAKLPPVRLRVHNTASAGELPQHIPDAAAARATAGFGPGPQPPRPAGRVWPGAEAPQTCTAQFPQTKQHWSGETWDQKHSARDTCLCPRKSTRRRTSTSSFWKRQIAAALPRSGSAVV